MPKCETCGREFSTEAALSQHTRDKHGGDPPRARSEAPRPVRKQKSLRRRDRHTTALALLVAAVAAGVVIYFVASPALAGPPFPAITGESWVHVHPYLVIDIAGANVTIPGDVGLVESGTAFEPVHTHDSSGILHIELSQSDASSHNYTLADFFTIWNYTAKTAGTSESPSLNGRVLPVVFSSTDILGFSSNSTYQVSLLVDGHDCRGSSYSLCPASPSQWGELNLEHLDYCSSSTVPPGTPPLSTPCYPTAAYDPSTQGSCTSATTSCTISNPYWEGSGSYPYGTGHTIVIKFSKV